jgi:hypothetical protein
MDFAEVSTEELQEELDRRNKPKTLTGVNGDKLQKLKTECEKYIERIAQGYSDLDDEEHYIFETALELFYGSNIWDWVNNKLK